MNLQMVHHLNNNKTHVLVYTQLNTNVCTVFSISEYQAEHSERCICIIFRDNSSETKMTAHLLATMVYKKKSRYIGLLVCSFFV
jgi:hypothetical protein